MPNFDEIKKLFEDVKGSYNYLGKKLINKGSVIKHLDGECNALYSQNKIQYVSRYRCHKCNKSTKGILVDNIDINNLPERIDKTITKDLSKDKKPIKPLTKEDFDKSFFDSDDYVVNGNVKEYNDLLESGDTVTSSKSLDRFTRLMPRYNIFQAFINRDKLGFDTETGVNDKESGDKSRETLLFTLSERGLLTKAKEYEASVKKIIQNGQLSRNLPLDGKEHVLDKDSVKEQNKLGPISGQNLDKTLTKPDKSKDSDEIEKQRLELVKKINDERQAKAIKTTVSETITKQDTTKTKSDIPMDFLQFISPEAIGRIIGKAEMDIINIIREKKFGKKGLNGEMANNCKESWKMLIGWLQWKYGDEWMEHIPLIAFALNQTTTIAKALTED